MGWPWRRRNSLFASEMNDTTRRRIKRASCEGSSDFITTVWQRPFGAKIKKLEIKLGFYADLKLLPNPANLSALFVNDNCRTWPFIFKIFTTRFEFRFKRITEPFWPENTMYLLHGEIIKYSKLFSLLPKKQILKRRRMVRILVCSVTFQDERNFTLEWSQKSEHFRMKMLTALIRQLFNYFLEGKNFEIHFVLPSDGERKRDNTEHSLLFE